MMRKTKIGANAITSFALLVVLATAYQAMSQQAMPQDPVTPYATMAPVEQYLMDRNQEIALARSAAPEAISRDATVLVLGRHGYETAVEGKSGWVCWVGRGWGIFDWPEFWSPKIRAADCMNPPAARSLLPFVYKRTELLLAGHSKIEVIAAIKAAIEKKDEKKELPSLEPGAMSYMMAKASYLADNGGHNGPHLMFYAPIKDAAAWGANLPNSPVMGVNYWYLSEQSYPQLQGFPPITVFLVGADKWSDGTPAPSM
ncbi:MAG: hypothetical protein WB919_01670 [Candidatus Sulfotelmatobacter sp.]